SAPALGAGVLSTEQTVIGGTGAQQNPAIAINPDAPLHAAVVADDTNTAGPFPRTDVATTADWSSAVWPAAALPHSGSTSAGQSDIAWGINSLGEQDVYLVEEDSLGGLLCQSTSNSGVFYSFSSDGGANWDTAKPISSGSSLTEAIEPAIAVDRSSPSGRIYVAYTRLDFATTNCGGALDSSEIFMLYSNDRGASWSVQRRVSPLATSGSAHYRSPSLAVLPDGRVIVAFRDDSNAQIETETCRFFPSPPATDYCGAPTAGLVGASTAVGDATAPAVVNGVSGLPTPSAVAAGGRVAVAWHASSGSAVRAFAAMSTDGGATFGPPQQIDPTGSGNQLAPDLAATASGRVDVAYLWDSSGTGIVSATTASANPPLPGATTEAWGNPVVVQAAGASGAIGRRLGVATAAISTAVSPLPATVISFTDTQAANNPDVHVVGLLHGTTAPVIDSSQTVTASKNISTIVHVDATDADGDPLTWSTGIGPTTPGSSVTTADPARGEFAFNAANKITTDSFEAVATDGAGNQGRAMINVKVVNDRPKITCSVLITREDTPLPVQVSDCATDPNNDPVTISLSDPTNGTIERVSGTWLFVPKLHSTATGSFMLHASDGDLSADQIVLVTVVSTIGKVNLTVPDADKTRTVASGLALRMNGSAVDATGLAIPIFWDFGDHTPIVRGNAVAHRFRKPGAFTVRATAGSEAGQIKVLVRRRAVELADAPSVVDGVMQLTVRTRAAGTLLLRADSRSQPLRVPAGLTQRTLRIQVTTGPLVRLTLRLTPSKAAPLLRVFTVRRIVLVSPLSAG
ncbi:MAG: PKD domain-containing protein, partial [Actinomycetota bacterium]|nr:PKD domain-containing protein [Actinomycetota bacterium]